MFSDLPHFIETVGYIGIFIIIFSETGLLVGVIFPGDTLLFSAGILAALGEFSLPLIIILSTVAAITGDAVGYLTGKKIGPKIFTKEDSFFFRKSHVEKAQKFFHDHGVKTIMFARFVPVVRTFAPFLAGVGKMQYEKFALYNVLGGIVWCVSVPLLGYYLGRTFPEIEKLILPLILAVVVLSFIPLTVAYFRRKNHV